MNPMDMILLIEHESRWLKAIKDRNGELSWTEVEDAFTRIKTSIADQAFASGPETRPAVMPAIMPKTRAALKRKMPDVVPAGAQTRPAEYTPIQAAKLANASRSLIFAALKDGRLPSIKRGSKRLIGAVDLESFIRERTS